MRAADGQEQVGGAVLTTANRSGSLTGNDTISQSIFQDSANPMRGERRFNYSKRLDCWRAVCKHEIDNKSVKLSKPEAMFVEDLSRSG
jgi:hypothetical protein